MNAEQMALCDSEVKALILKLAIVLSKEELGDFISNIFVFKGFRPVINLKYLNEFLFFHRFKMEGLHMLNSLVNKGDFVVKLDLKRCVLHHSYTSGSHTFFEISMAWKDLYVYLPSFWVVFGPVGIYEIIASGYDCLETSGRKNHYLFRRLAHNWVQCRGSNRRPTESHVSLAKFRFHSKH